MGKRSAVVELFLGDMGSIQRELRPSIQREDQLTMETKLEQIAVKAVNQLPKSVVREIRTPRSVGAGGGRPPPATRWMWKRSHGGTIEAPPDERGGNRYVLPNATAPHLDSTHFRTSTRVTVRSAFHPRTDIVSSTVRSADLPDGLFGSSAVQPLLQKNFPSRLTQINSISLDVPSLRGALARSSRTRDGMRWTRQRQA